MRKVERGYTRNNSHGNMCCSTLHSITYFLNDKDNRDTQVNLQLKFGTALAAEAQVFVMSHYTRKVSMVSQDGFLASVDSINA